LPISDSRYFIKIGTQNVKLDRHTLISKIIYPAHGLPSMWFSHGSNIPN